MHTRSSAAQWTFWGSIAFLSLAAVGLGLAAWGGLEVERWLLILGGSIFVAALLGYLSLQLGSTISARRSQLAPESDEPENDGEGWLFEPEDPNPPHASPAPNFGHLLSHTLERAEIPAIGPRAHAEVPRIHATNGGTTFMVAPPRHYEEKVRLSAVQRRPEIVKDLPLLREILGEAEAPIREDKPGKTRGQCSACATILWAPAVRPIRLRCPKCGRTATLET